MHRTFLIPYMWTAAAVMVSAQTPATPSMPPDVMPSALRVTVDDAVKMALDHNVDLNADRLDPQIGDTRVAAVRLRDDSRDLFLRDGLHVTGATVRQLDEVDAVFALTAHLRDHLRRAVAEDADPVIRGAHPGGLVVLDAAVRDDHAARAVHARSLEHSEPDGVPDPDVREPGAAGHGDAGHPGPQHLLGAPRRFEHAESQAWSSPGLDLPRAAAGTRTRDACGRRSVRA